MAVISSCSTVSHGSGVCVFDLAHNRHRTAGMVRISQSALKKVKDGHTSLDETVRFTSGY